MTVAKKLGFPGLCLLITLSACSETPETPPSSAPPADAEPAGVHAVTSDGVGVTILYFFHRTIRCHECLSMELLTETLLDRAFSDEMVSGKMVHEVHNLDEPENEHYADDFELTFSSVVLAGFDESGTIVRWKLLEDAWEKSVDADAFSAYLVDEINAWLSSTGQVG